MQATSSAASSTRINTILKHIIPGFENQQQYQHQLQVLALEHETTAAATATTPNSAIPIHALKSLISLSSHVLDTTLGKPASGIRITVAAQVHQQQFVELVEGYTNNDGRVTGDAWKNLPPANSFNNNAGVVDTFKVTFDVASYAKKTGQELFYPVVEIVFKKLDNKHYHIPLLLSPFGYGTYRGS